jgi:spermidine synthase
MMAHVPMLTLKKVRKVIVIGGIAYGLIKQLLKHDEIVQIIQIDRETSTSKQVADQFAEY